MIESYHSHSRMTAGEISEAAGILLDDRGIESWRQNNHATRGRKFIGKRGVPDRIGWCRETGKFVGCEVKADGDRLSNDQKDFLGQLNASGGFGYVATQDKDGFVILELFK